MKILSDIINVLLGLISTFCLYRIVVNLNAMNMDLEDTETPALKKKTKNAVIFMIIAVCILSMKIYIEKYYGGPIF